MKKTLSLFAISALSALAQTVNPQALVPSTARSANVQVVYSATNQSASIASFNLQCPQSAANSPAGASSAVAGTVNAIQSVPPSTVGTSTSAQICPAGVYRITLFLQNTSGTNGGGTATPTFTYHASGGTQSITSGLCSALTESTNNVQQGSYLFYTDGTAALTLAIAQGSSGNFDAFAQVERLQ